MTAVALAEEPRCFGDILIAELSDTSGKECVVSDNMILTTFFRLRKSLRHGLQNYLPKVFKYRRGDVPPSDQAFQSNLHDLLLGKWDFNLDDEAIKGKQKHWLELFKFFNHQLNSTN